MYKKARLAKVNGPQGRQKKESTMRLYLRVLGTLVFLLAASSTLLYSADIGDFLKGLPQRPGSGGAAPGAGLDNSTIASGLKDALSIGTRNAVNLVSRPNGYFANQAIKILLPENIQNVAELAGKVGFQKEVDEFILSMNRAAEKAAPKAASYFADAIKEMTIEDARRILSGGDTAATEYFKSKTSSKLYNEFKPSVSESMKQVGVARAYNSMMGKAPSLPFVQKESVDLDHYVTTKALDGLFYMVGQEEQKIRTNPAARTTDLLKKVFGK
jgi:hypothetical protein